jgi:hypothetical protein
MDGHPRQNPAYRPATEEPRSGGALPVGRGSGVPHGVRGKAAILRLDGVAPRIRLRAVYVDEAVLAGQAARGDERRFRRRRLVGREFVNREAAEAFLAAAELREAIGRAGVDGSSVQIQLADPA